MVEEYEMQPAELCVWGEIRVGRIADFNKRERRELASNVLAGWTDLRTLSSQFLRMLVFNESFRSCIPAEGIRIAGAWFKEPVDLTHGRLSHQLWLEKCRFEEIVDLGDLHVNGWLSLEGSTFSFESDKENDLLSLDLADANISGQLVLDDVTVAGLLHMDTLEVGQDIYMRSYNSVASFQDIISWGARIRGYLIMNSTYVYGSLDMEGIEVGQNFYIQTAHLAEVKICNSRIGGRLYIHGTEVSGTLDMTGLEINRDLFMGSGSKFLKKISLTLARIGSNLDISGAELGKLDLSAAYIGGELLLGSNPESMTVWRGDAHLNLRNAQAAAVQDPRLEPHAWPGRLELDGFTYNRLGGFQSGRDAGRSGDGISGYIGWLERDTSYTPQPYAQLADAFRRSGEPAKAERVLYESRERERREASGWGRWLWLTVLKWTIGYGIGLRYFRAFGWVAAFTLLGAILIASPSSQGVGSLSRMDLGRSQIPAKQAAEPQEPLNDWPAKVAYSLDELLPIVQLDKAHEDIRAEGYVKYYFYLHRLVGWTLASFLVAGLAGLTQR
jgi:hypothetical protein